MSRILAALVLIPPLLAVVLYAPAFWFLILVEIVALLAAHEFFGLFKTTPYRPFRHVGSAGALALVASFYFPASTAWLVMGLLLVTAGAAIARANPGATAPGDVALTVLGACYTGLLPGAVVGLRLTPGGRSWIVLLLAIIFLGDTGAYYTGRALGRRPLTPRISPKKTWAGFYGGVLASLGAALLFREILSLAIPWWHAVGLGLALSLLGVLGDLFESLLKRSVGVKDASSLIPGHGGILDRLDSLLFSAPALLLYVQHAGAMTWGGP